MTGQTNSTNALPADESLQVGVAAAPATVAKGPLAEGRTGTTNVQGTQQSSEVNAKKKLRKMTRHIPLSSAAAPVAAKPTPVAAKSTPMAAKPTPVAAKPTPFIKKGFHLSTALAPASTPNHAGHHRRICRMPWHGFMITAVVASVGFIFDMLK